MCTELYLEYLKGTVDVEDIEIDFNGEGVE
jgi:hypothetical protein